MIELTIDRKKRAALKMSSKKIPSRYYLLIRNLDFVKESVDLFLSKAENKRLTLTYLG